MQPGNRPELRNFAARLNRLKWRVTYATGSVVSASQPLQIANSVLLRGRLERRLERVLRPEELVARATGANWTAASLTRLQPTRGPGLWRWADGKFDAEFSKVLDAAAYDVAVLDGGMCPLTHAKLRSFNVPTIVHWPSIDPREVNRIISGLIDRGGAHEASARPYLIPAQVIGSSMADLRSATYNQFLSAGAAGTFLANGGWSSNWVVNRIGFDASPFIRARGASDPSQGNRDSPLHVGFLGRANVLKGVLDLVEAARDARVPLRVSIAGQADHAVRAAGASASNVRLLGLLTRDQVPEFLASVDLVALPSYFEGLPSAALEALASGRPLLSSDSVPVGREVADRGAGWVFPTGDVRALTMILERVAHAPEILDPMRERARAYAAEFTWEAFCDTMSSVAERIS